MNNYDFCQAISSLGLSQVGAARLFDYNQRTARRWASGESPVPRIVEVALWLMVERGVSPDDIPPPVDEEAEFYKSVGGGPIGWTRLPAFRQGGLDKQLSQERSPSRSRRKGRKTPS